MCGVDKLMETLKQRLEEQQKRNVEVMYRWHFASYNPEGERIGQNVNRHGRAVKVWDKRSYRNHPRNTKQGRVLDVKIAPKRHNAVKVLVLFDIGGSMDDYIHTYEELFSAAHSEFKHLAFYYFQNCLYERVWQDNERRHSNVIDTMTMINKFTSDYKVLFLGGTLRNRLPLLAALALE